MVKFTLQQHGAVVITGAASGIGAALAKQLVQEQANLALLDQNLEGLNRLAEILIAHPSAANLKITTHQTDVTDRVSVAAAATQVQEMHGGAHTLINSAGSSMLGSFEEITLEEFEWLININLWGTLIPTKIFLEQLLQKPTAHISNIASAYALIAPAGRIPYSTSKFAIRGFTEALRSELSDSNISVCVVHPGGIQTGLVSRARVAASADPQIIKRVMAAQLAEYGTTADEAAQQIIKAIKKRKPRLLIGKDAKGLDLMARIAPAKYWHFLKKRLAAATEI